MSGIIRSTNIDIGGLTEQTLTYAVTDDSNNSTEITKKLKLQIRPQLLH